jgi:hypothetical protein
MQKKKISPAKQKLFLVLGFVCVALGAIGVFLPVLPTTPFLLLAAALFLRSSDRFYRWLTEHKVFGRFIRNYRRYKAIPLHSKIVMLAFLWLMIGYSAIFAVHWWWLRLLLVLIAVGVSWHIFSLKTLTPEMEAENAILEAEEKRIAEEQGI